MEKKVKFKQEKKKILAIKLITLHQKAFDVEGNAQNK